MYINLIKNNMTQEEIDHIGDTNKMVTAVEWFYKKLVKGKLTGKDTIEFLYEVAKEMEKEQMFEAYWEDEPICFLKYYNETYGDK